MAERNKSSCLVVVLVFVAVFVIVIGGIFFVFLAKTSSHAEPPDRHQEDSSKVLVIRGDEFPALPFPIAGEELTREQFITFLYDDNATKLAKEEFRKIANQAKVRWELRTTNISDENGQLQGQFDLPWEIRSNNSSMGSSVTVQCEFGPEVRSHLLNLRRDDWITIEGQLSFDGSQPTIQNARIVGGALPAENE